jgi:CheY-like chemotaxis protein/anti-sigma regulatory factor (Ser/Thr protein kinase)
LRTPLNLIVGFTEVMIQSPEYYGQALPPNYLHDLGIVYRNACHLQDLIGDVLDLARIEAAQMSLMLEKIAPQDIVCTVIKTVRSLAESHRLYLRAEVQPNLPEIWVDTTRIRQVLFNLINNAVRFTEHGGITIHVTQQGPDVRFAVTDTGVGIAPENIDRIFEEFEQLDSSTHRAKGGAGLGLAISRQFVTLHKGRMGVKSNLGEGSTFFFTLPADKTPHEPAEGESLLRTIQVGDVKNLDEPILLVVTRSPTAATMLTRYVQGLRTVVAPDLSRAGEAAQQLMPQMIVIDQANDMLDTDQMQTLIRAWNLPQTILVGCPLPGEEILRQRLDVDGYLVKPVSHQSLWDVLRQFGEEVDRILVIDDDQDFILFISRLLEDNPVRSYRVRSANSGQEALALLNHYTPDLILLDMVLPDINGDRVAQQIRTLEQARAIPIIFVSAQDVMDYQAPMPGTVTIARSSGLTPSEVVKWIQALAATAVSPRPTLEAPQATPAP